MVLLLIAGNLQLHSDFLADGRQGAVDGSAQGGGALISETAHVGEPIGSGEVGDHGQHADDIVVEQLVFFFVGGDAGETEHEEVTFRLEVGVVPDRGDIAFVQRFAVQFERTVDGGDLVELDDRLEVFGCDFAVAVPANG